jgi:peptidylprolyl isomerase
MRALALTIAVCAGLLLAGCGGDDDSTSESTQSGDSTAVEKSGDASSRSKPEVKVPGGEPPTELEEIEQIEGTGAEAKSGDEVTVQYVGVNYRSGKEFDASWDRGEPFPFQLGAGMVIPGWDKGVEGMKVGGRRELIIPPNLAYGPEGRPPVIPPNETLIFVIDLLEVG